ncbi:MAG: RNase adapter RapZ [Candidatus Nanopelagicaceae bacterium]|nr:RNase adapter RapZ [Candidatus Nanopelagicaceae bacterium]
MNQPREVLILTGMSGAGRSTVAHALEDLGWYVVDNVPAALLPALVEQTDGAQISMMAVVVDVRSGRFFDDLNNSLLTLEADEVPYRLLFLDATDQSLVQRFESTRRPHPLQGTDRIVDGIARERARLEDLRSRADVVIDTSNLNVHELDKRVGEIFSAGHDRGVRFNVLSFGYKYGIPVDADLLLDCRFIPNPHWIPELRALNGLSEPVSKNVLSSPGVNAFVDNYVSLLHQMVEGYLREGKKYVTLAVGCTGGKHRSVAISEAIASRLNQVKGPVAIEAHALHRDVGRE